MINFGRRGDLPTQVDRREVTFPKQFYLRNINDEAFLYSIICYVRHTGTNDDNSGHYITSGRIGDDCYTLNDGTATKDISKLEFFKNMTDSVDIVLATYLRSNIPSTTAEAVPITDDDDDNNSSPDGDKDVPAKKRESRNPHPHPTSNSKEKEPKTNQRKDTQERENNDVVSSPSSSDESSYSHPMPGISTRQMHERIDELADKISAMHQEHTQGLINFKSTILIPLALHKEEILARLHHSDNTLHATLSSAIDTLHSTRDLNAFQSSAIFADHMQQLQSCLSTSVNTSTELGTALTILQQLTSEDIQKEDKTAHLFCENVRLQKALVLSECAIAAKDDAIEQLTGKAYTSRITAPVLCPRN